MTTSDKVWRRFASAIVGACGDEPLTVDVTATGEAELPSIFACTDLAVGSIAAAGMAVAELVTLQGGSVPRVSVDRRLASLWFGSSIRPIGWSLPPVWDSIAGDYRTRDGWIKLHTNAPRHREAALRVLRVEPTRSSVADAVLSWEGADLESAILAEGGCAAEMRSPEAWAGHPQGRAVASEPLIDRARTSPRRASTPGQRCRRPLDGVRVLDLTRILAGPVATRFLAGLGAEVLRLDPLAWDEPSLAPDVTLGKRCARLDLKEKGGALRLRELVATADVVLHGYRPGAMACLGFSTADLEEMSPGLVQVTLNAYGWTGPWSNRRGFDSLVQMSAGLSSLAMDRAGSCAPVHLPVQALDHATGYIMACAALRALAERIRDGRGAQVRASLARTARLLVDVGGERSPFGAKIEAASTDFAAELECTSWGTAHRLIPPVAISGVEIRWDRPATPLGTHQPEWTA